MSFGVNNMSKRKKKKGTQTCFISRDKAEKWYGGANFLACSLLSMEEAIHGFNKLSSKDRFDIQNAWKTLDEQRRIILKDVDKEEGERSYFDLVFVDTHIIATNYNTDPVVAAMCVSSPYSLLNKIVVK